MGGRTIAIGDIHGCAGALATLLGAIALLDTKTMSPAWEVPITLLSPAGNVITRNPIDVRVVNGHLRIYVAPDDDSTTIFTYEAQE